MSQFSTWSNLISLRTWCSLESSYTCPDVLVFETRKPDCANVLGVHMSAKAPPPPSAIQRLGYWLSQRLRRSGSAVWLLLYGLVPLPCPPRKRTSSTSDRSPAFQSTATARGLVPPVKMPI